MVFQEFDTCFKGVSSLCFMVFKVRMVAFEGPDGSFPQRVARMGESSLRRRRSSTKLDLLLVPTNRSGGIL